MVFLHSFPLDKTFLPKHKCCLWIYAQHDRLWGRTYQREVSAEICTRQARKPHSKILWCEDWSHQLRTSGLLEWGCASIFQGYRNCFGSWLLKSCNSESYRSRWIWFFTPGKIFLAILTIQSCFSIGNLLKNGGWKSLQVLPWLCQATSN